MAREKKLEPPGDDIPAWFMTYSDVITLLMTFFILLLTFATNEPERFEKSVKSTFSSGSATGLIGKKMSSTDNDSWINRLRPPSARIAMRGAEMPPITTTASKAAFGEGLRSLNEEEEQQNAMTSHFFDVPAAHLFEYQGELSPIGKQICKMLAKQLQDLPFHASVQFVDPELAMNITGLMSHMYDNEKIRPGQLGMNRLKSSELSSDKVRIMVRRFTEGQR